MKETTGTIVINCTKEVADDLRRELDAQPGTSSTVTPRRNLDGDTAAWIVIANLAGQALPHILTFLQTYLNGKRVKRIRIGDIEVENPSPEDIVRLQKLLDSRSAKGGGVDD